MKPAGVFAFLAAILVTLGSAHVHAQTIEFKVPFDFTVQNSTLRAGTYQVSRRGHMDQTLVEIRSADRRSSAMIATHAAEEPSTGGAFLIFVRYGNKYFLHQVLCNELSMHMEVPPSKLEQARIREVQMLTPGKTLATIATVAAALPTGKN
jgi:hypothetical protein